MAVVACILSALAIGALAVVLLTQASRRPEDVLSGVTKDLLSALLAKTSQTPGVDINVIRNLQSNARQVKNLLDQMDQQGGSESEESSDGLVITHGQIGQSGSENEDTG